MQDSDDRAPGELDLERGARDGERITKCGLRRGPERPARGGRAAEDRLGPRARHGTVPTPPRASRAQMIVPSSISSAAAAAVSANSYDALSRTFR